MCNATDCMQKKFLNKNENMHKIKRNEEKKSNTHTKTEYYAIYTYTYLRNIRHTRGVRKPTQSDQNAIQKQKHVCTCKQSFVGCLNMSCVYFYGLFFRFTGIDHEKNALYWHCIASQHIVLYRTKTRREDFEGG